MELISIGKDIAMKSAYKISALVTGTTKYVDLNLQMNWLLGYTGMYPGHLEHNIRNLCAG
jgi:hypothetical protein